MAKQIRLTTKLRDSILGAIRAGGYPHIAAEAFGVPQRIFDDWRTRGERDGAREPYRSFATGLREAVGVARLLVETALYKDDPQAWLIRGPGRETSERPGWSVPVNAAEPATEVKNVLCIPGLMHLFNSILDALHPFPDARDHVAQIVANVNVPKAMENDHGTTSA